MANYSINAVTRRVVYSGSAGAGPYAFAFEVLEANDLAVYKNITLLTLTTDYTVSIGAAGTGSVTLVSAATGSDTITITGARDIERTTDFVTAGDLKAAALNEQLDSQIIMIQQVSEANDRAIKAPVTDPTSIDMTLPAKDTRKGKYLAFNETTGNPEAGASSDDVATLASITDDIATLADIEDGTENTDAIQTVAGISGNVTTVAGISGNVTTVAGISSNVTSVAGNATNINTVAGISGNVTTVAGISSDVTAVAGDATDIGTVATDLAGSNTIGTVATDLSVSDTIGTVATDLTGSNTIGTVATDLSGSDTIGTVATDLSGSDTIGTVAGIASDVTTVAGISGDVTTVAADGTDIGTVAGISANVTTVAGISGNVTTVAGISGNVTTVAGISSNVTTVAGISGNVTTVAGISSDVTAVAGDATDIGTVATNLAGSNTIGTVAGIAADVTTVAGISGDVSSVAAQVVGYAFSTTTTMADPGSGNVRFNNATVSSVTAIAIDDLDSNGVDQSAYIAIWDDSTNTVKGTLVFRTVGGDIATFSITGLTDNTGWFQIAVTHVASSGTFSAAEDCYIGFTRAGDKGADGAGSGDVSGPGAAVTDNAVVRWDTTSGQLVQNSTVTVSDVGAVAAGSLTLTTDLAVADGGTGASDAATARTNLGLGTISTQAANSVNIDGGAIDGTTIGGSSAAAGTFTTFTSTGIDDNATSTAVTINSSQNVGIGTSAPAQILETKELDSTGFTGIRINNPNANVGSAGIEFQVDGTYSKAAIYQTRKNANGNGDLIFVTDSATDAANWAASDEKMRITSGGNVGIGTTSPQTQLHVSDPAGGDVYSRFTTTSYTTGFDVGIASSGITQNWNRNNTPWRVATNNIERMRIESSGNVGIGTTSPASTLDVNGTISATTFGTSSQNAYGARTVSTSSPTGGSDGDIWYKY